MNRYLRASALCALALALTFLQVASAQASADQPVDGERQSQIQQAFGKLPIVFEENHGQVDPSVKFLFRGVGSTLFLTAQEAVMVLSKPEGATRKHRSAVIRMRFDGANQAPIIKGIDEAGFKSNYFLGTESATQYTDITNFHRVKYTSLYSGVDLVYYGNQQQLEYDLLIAPHADPQQIKLRFSGADKVSLSKEGHLVIATAFGAVIHHKPVAYQEIDGVREPVEARYVLRDGGKLAAFKVGQYNPRKPLIIDPVVSYSTGLWGQGSSMAVDANGNVYICGFIDSAGLPASNGYQTKLAGSTDAYVAKLDPSGTKVIYATYLGARRAVTDGYKIGVDASGNAYLAGITDSAAFPVTAGAYQTAKINANSTFLTKFNAAGNGLLFSTFLNADIESLAVDGPGNVYMTGGGGFPTTPGAYRSAGTAYVAKLNATGSALVYSTYLAPGSAQTKAIAIDPNGNAYVTGIANSPDFPMVNPVQSTLKGTQDAFALKLNPGGTALIYSTYLGGSGVETGSAIAVNAAGQAVVAGQTNSGDFPVTAAAFQRGKGYPGTAVSNGFVAKLSDTGALIYSSFLGGTWCSACRSASYDQDSATAVAVDAAGYAYVGGYAGSYAFPYIDSFAPLDPGSIDAPWAAPFMVKVSPGGDRMIYAVSIGLMGQDRTVDAVAVDTNGNGYVLSQNLYGFDDWGITAGAVYPGAVYPSGRSYLTKISTGKFSTFVRSSLSPSDISQSITFTADVLSAIPGGTVTFMDGATSLGAASVVNGAATLTSALPAGVHKITAVYSLDGKVSPPFYQIVNSK